MSNIIQIYRMMFKYWISMIMGLIAMLLYALFSGVSITILIPLFDYVLNPNKPQILYHNYHEFLAATGRAFSSFTNTHGSFFSIRPLNEYKPIWEELKNVMLHTNSIALLYVLCGFIVILVILKNACFFWQRMCFVNLRGKTIRDVRNYMFNRYLQQSLEFFNTNQVGDSIVRMVNDVDIVSNNFINSILNALRDVITILVYMRLAIFLNPKLFIYSVVVLPVFSVSVSVLGKKLKKYSFRIQGQISSMFSNVEEVLNSMKIVKAFRAEEREFTRFSSINNRYQKLWARSQVYSSLNVPISEFNTTFTGILVIIIGGSMILDQNAGFSLGDFTAFLFALFSMLHPMKTLTQLYNEVRQALVSLDRIALVMNKESSIQDAADAVHKPSFDDRIEFRSVSFWYKPGKYAVKNVSMEIRKGMKVALVGSSGGGKTTLANLINRMYEVCEGAILIDGIDIRKIKLDDLRRLFGIVTQDSILFTKTARENIAYGSYLPVTDEQVINAARIAHAEEFIMQLPEKYDSQLETKGANLSGGQRQRLCIARAIVADPPILIFDEATSALDTESEQKVQDAIEEATQNRTVVLIAHRLSTILKADKIVVIEKGQIVGEGSHDELLETCPRYQHLYKLQFKS